MFARKTHPQVTPIDFSHSPESVKHQLDETLYAVYKTVWNGAAANLSSPPIIRRYCITLSIDETISLHFSSSEVIEPGWFKFKEIPPCNITPFSNNPISEIKENFDINLFDEKKLEVYEHETEPPKHYDVPALMNKLIEKSIAKPSSLASLMNKITEPSAEHIHFNQENFLLTTNGKNIVKCLNQLPSTKLDYRFTERLEEQLDQIELGYLKASEVIQHSLEAVFPDLFKEQLPTWIDDLMGDTQERPKIREKKQIHADPTHLSLDRLDIDKILPKEHPFRTIKKVVDSLVSSQFDGALPSSELQTQWRIIKAIIYQKLLKITSYDHYLITIKFNFLLRWLIDLPTLAESWSISFFKKCINDPEITQISHKILTQLEIDEQMYQSMSALGM